MFLKFQNCLSVAPKCTNEFSLKGCSYLYNTWNPVVCTGDSIINAEGDLSKIIYSPPNVSHTSYCIQPISCCTEYYKDICHNLVGCYPAERKCTNEYNNRLLYSLDENSLNKIYKCSNKNNAYEALPCCDENITTNCIVMKVDCDPKITDCDCVPSIPCCDSLNIDIPCHNLVNCKPKKPCCLFKNNMPAIVDKNSFPTRVCTGCPSNILDFDENDVATCCHFADDSVDCTKDIKRTIEYKLCSSNILAENECVSKLPCCVRDLTDNIDYPLGCISDTTNCLNDNRPCCIIGNIYPKGCK